MSTYQVEQVELEQQRTAVVRGRVRVGEIPAFLGGAFDEIVRALAAQGLTPAGPPFGRYTPAGDGFDVEAGFPTDHEVRAQGRIVAATLPGGPAAQVLHKGDYAAVAAAYEAASQWAAAHGYVVAGPPWESYLDGPDVAEPRTVVCLPCRRAEQRR